MITAMITTTATAAAMRMPLTRAFGAAAGAVGIAARATRVGFAFSAPATPASSPPAETPPAAEDAAVGGHFQDRRILHRARGANDVQEPRVVLIDHALHDRAFLRRHRLERRAHVLEPPALDRLGAGADFPERSFEVERVED